MVEDWRHDERTILLSLSPLSHHIATVALEQMLGRAGCELVVNDPPPGMSTLDWLLTTGVTYVMGVPTHAMDILDAARKRGLARLGAVKIFYMAGAPIPRETAQELPQDRGITPQNIYGMTENGSHQYTLPGRRRATPSSRTCGRACRRLRGENLQARTTPTPRPAPGEVGEIGGRGARAHAGLFRRPAGATDRSFNRSRLVHERRSRAPRREQPPGNTRPQEGAHHPRRRQHLSRLHRGSGASSIQPSPRAAAFLVADRRLGEKVCPGGGRRARARILDPLGRCSAHLRAAGLSIYDMPEYFVAIDAFPPDRERQGAEARARRAWAQGGTHRSSQPIQWSERPGTENVT